MFRPVCLTQIQFLPPPDTVSVTPFPPVVLELREAPDWLDPATHVEPDPELRSTETTAARRNLDVYILQSDDQR